MERMDEGKTSQERKVNRRGFLKRLVGLSGEGEDASLLDTVKLSTALALTMASTFPLAAKLQESIGVNIGNGGATPEITQWLQENPGVDFALGSVVAPAWEETVFRILPSAALSATKLGTAWRVGIPSSVAFATAHGFSIDNPSTDELNRLPQMKIASLPLYQFGSGLFLWKLVRDRGWLHTIVSHSTINTTLLLAQLFKRAVVLT